MCVACDGWSAHDSYAIEHPSRRVCETSDADRGLHPVPSCPQPPEDPHRRRTLMMKMSLRHTADSQCRQLEPLTCLG